VYHKVDPAEGWSRFTIRCSPGKGFCLKNNGYHPEDEEVSPVYVHVTPQGFRQQCMSPLCVPFLSQPHPLPWNDASKDAKHIEVAVTMDDVSEYTSHDVGDAQNLHFYARGTRRSIRLDPMDKNVVYLKPWNVLFPTLLFRDVTGTWHNEMMRSLGILNTPEMRVMELAAAAVQRKRSLALQYAPPENPAQFQRELLRMPAPRSDDFVFPAGLEPGGRILTFAQLCEIEVHMTAHRLAVEERRQKTYSNFEEKRELDRVAWASIRSVVDSAEDLQEQSDEEEKDADTAAAAAAAAAAMAMVEE
jgi:hypothetical protein